MRAVNKRIYIIRIHHFCLGVYQSSIHTAWRTIFLLVSATWYCGLKGTNLRICSYFKINKSVYQIVPFYFRHVNHNAGETVLYRVGGDTTQDWNRNKRHELKSVSRALIEEDKERLTVQIQPDHPFVFYCVWVRTGWKYCEYMECIRTLFLSMIWYKFSYFLQ